MILTVTLNPSVDIRYKLNQFLINNVNRVNEVEKTAGGKGLNVSRVLKQLGEEVAATGFLGGDLGNYIHSQLKKFGIQNFFVNISDETRNCIAIIHGEYQTEILENGPVISPEEMKLFLHIFMSLIDQTDYVVISGSLPRGVTNKFYEEMIEIATNENTPVLLDTNGEILKKMLKSKYKPFLIKPNQEEFSNLLGISINDDYQIKEALKSPLLDGIEWIVVTLGAKGAIVRHKDRIYRVKIPVVETVNPVGSGDSVIAGFASGLFRKYPDEQLIKYGVAMGVLNAMEKITGYINPDKIKWCIDQITLEEIT